MFPSLLGNLHQLRMLVASHNRLIGLPNMMATMTSLTTLQLESNGLKELPSTLALMPNLTVRVQQLLERVLLVVLTFLGACVCALPYCVRHRGCRWIAIA